MRILMRITKKFNTSAINRSQYVSHPTFSKHRSKLRLCESSKYEKSGFSLDLAYEEIVVYTRALEVENLEFIIQARFHTG